MPGGVTRNFCVRRLSRLARECLCFGLGIVLPPNSGYGEPVARPTGRSSVSCSGLPGSPLPALQQGTDRALRSNLSRSARTGRHILHGRAAASAPTESRVRATSELTPHDPLDRNSDRLLRPLSRPLLRPWPTPDAICVARRPSAGAPRLSPPCPRGRKRRAPKTLT